MIAPLSSTRQGDGLDKAPAPGAAPREPLVIGRFSMEVLCELD